MTQKATRLPTKTDRLLQNQKKVKDLYALNRLRITPRTIQNPSGGSIGAGGDVSSAAESNSLKSQGDTMVGPIAFFPVDVFIDSTTDPENPSINIGEGASNPPDYSTYVLVTGGNPPTDLSTIFGAAFAGQMLKMQAIVDIVIKDAVAAGSGNILTTTNQDETLAAGTITEFLFDITSSPGGVQGAWRRATTGDGGGGSTGTLGELADVDLSLPLVDAEVLTYNSASGFWENIPPQSGGMNTDLSNMISPTIPSVPLSMNNQNITGVNALEFDSNGAKSITTLDNIFFNKSQQSIRSNDGGINLRVNSDQEIIFETPNGIIAKFDEVNAADRRLEMQGNRINDVAKISFSPVLTTPTANTSQIFEEAGFNSLFYVARGGSHVFKSSQTNDILLTIGHIVGGGGLLQDIGFMNFNANQILTTFIDGDMELVFQSGSSGPADFFIHSGGISRNISDIGQGGVTNQISQGNSNVTVTDTGTGAVTIAVDAASIASFTNSIGVVFDKDLNMGNNEIKTTGAISPGATSTFDIGGQTLYYNFGFMDSIILKDFTQHINGTDEGIRHNVTSGKFHQFQQSGHTIMSVGSDFIDLHEHDIENVNSLILSPPDNFSFIDMAFGSILSLDFIGFVGPFRRIDGPTQIRWETSEEIVNVAFDSVSPKQLAWTTFNEDVRYVFSADTIPFGIFDLTTDNGQVAASCGKFRITALNGSFGGFSGALSHEGNQVGFFNKQPQPVSTVTFLTGAENLLQTQDKINQLLSALGSTASGVGLIRNS